MDEIDNSLWPTEISDVTTTHFAMITDKDREAIGREFTTNLIKKNYFSRDDQNLIYETWTGVNTDKKDQDKLIASWTNDGLHIYRPAFIDESELGTNIADWTGNFLNDETKYTKKNVKSNNNKLIFFLYNVCMFEKIPQ